MSTRLAQRRLAKTAAYTIVAPADSSGTIFTNRGALGSVTITLPKPSSALIGWWYDFFVQADQSLIVAGNAAGDIVAPGNGSANNVGFQSSGSRVGRKLRAQCDGTSWFCAPMGAIDGFNVNGVDTAIAGLLTESATNAIAAFAGGGQASATALVSEVNRVTTVTTAGDSVKLPTALAGLTIVVVNKGANAMAVFPATGDAVDGLAANASVTQMAGSMVIYSCAVAGQWDSEGLGTGYSGSLQTLSFTAGLTAFSTGGQASAVALPSTINRVSTVAAAGDSVKLPAAAVGLAITVINKGANPMQVFGAGTDTINGIATATGISQGINTNATFVCTVAGNWEVPLTSLISTTPQTIGTAAPALPAHTSHTYVFNRAGVVAATLAAPTAGTDDGIEIVITSDSANAHTLTATGLLDTGSAAVNLATFAAFKGAGLTLMAFNGRWKVLAQIGITFS